MAGNAVWGIDLGQCALKALRCTLDDEGAIRADAFDYIEYPKILSQPDAEPDVLIQEALDQFLSRNQIKGDRVAIAVSGQAGLARFIKLPPVDSSKIPDIVKYEAKQQIPFPLDEVVWDYQQLAGGTEEDGFALETEVGLFAMKRDQVFKAIKPFDDAGFELDVIQLSPLAIYNMVTHDVLTDLPPADQYNPDKPPESLVILSMGTDTSDLVITNGYRVWQRSIPIGGNHFTRQLTKELKLTFAKAEHLKRNARQAEDPKAVFQAMRPVFADLVTELQRSIGFFRSIDRSAEIGRLLVLGNTVKLPGLVQYLGKNLETEVIDLEEYNQLKGASVTRAPSFEENIASFGVAYGLCVQGLGKAKLATSLLPREILINRLVKEKKPWAAAAVGAVMLGLAFWFAFGWNRAYTADPERTGSDSTTRWKAAIEASGRVKNESDRFKQDDDKAVAEYARLTQLGRSINSTDDGRLLWLELLAAINAGLPYDEEFGKDVIPTKKPLNKRKQLHITKIDSEYFPDLAAWWVPPVPALYAQQKADLFGTAAPMGAIPPGGPMPMPGAPMAAPEPGATPDPNAPTDSPLNATPPTPGWVVEIAGYHFFNESAQTGQVNFIRHTLLKHLHEGTVELPVGDHKERFTLKELGVLCPVLIIDPKLDRSWKETNPDYEPPVAGGDMGVRPTGPEVPQQIIVPRMDFTIQFVWKETPLSVRLQRRIDAQKAAEAAAAAGGGPAPGPAPPMTPTGPAVPMTPTSPMAVAPPPMK